MSRAAGDPGCSAGGDARHVRETIAADTMLEAGGIVTAANAGQICDGASGVPVVRDKASKAHGATR